MQFQEIIAILSLSSSVITSIALCYYCKNKKRHNNVVLEEVITNNIRALDNSPHQETSL